MTELPLLPYRLRDGEPRVFPTTIAKRDPTPQEAQQDREARAALRASEYAMWQRLGDEGRLRAEELRTRQVQEQVDRPIPRGPDPRIAAPTVGPLPSPGRLTRQKTKASAKARLIGVGMWLVGVLILLGVYGANTKPHHPAPAGIIAAIDLGMILIPLVAIVWVRWMGRRRYWRSSVAGREPVTK